MSSLLSGLRNIQGKGMISIVEKHEDREYKALATSTGVVLCDKEEGAFLVLRSVNDLERLKHLLNKIEVFQ